MSITAGSQFSWSKHSISMPFEFRYLSQGRLEFVETCADYYGIKLTHLTFTATSYLPPYTPHVGPLDPVNI